MVIRRIREHVAELNWLAVAVDLAIVVVGVFLGTQANNWNTARTEREQSISYRSRLIDELDFNARQFRQQIFYYQQVRGHGLAALVALNGLTNPPARLLLIDSYQLSQIDTSTPKTFIYNEMVSSGLVDRLGDEAIQAIASDYYMQLAANDHLIREIFPYRTIIRTVMPVALQEQITTDCGDRLVYDKQRVVGVRLVEDCQTRLDPVAVAEGDRLVRREPGIAREMTRYLASINEKLILLDLERNQTIDFRNRLIAASRGA